MQREDIQNALSKILSDHQGLTKTKLTLLLEAANWDTEDRHTALQIFDETPAQKVIDEVAVPKEIVPEKVNEEVKVEKGVEESKISEDHVVIPYESHFPIAKDEHVAELTLSHEDALLQPEPVKSMTQTVPQETKKEVKPVGTYDSREMLPPNLPVRPFASSAKSIPFAHFGRFFTPHTEVMPPAPVHYAPPLVQRPRLQIHFNSVRKEDMSLVVTAIAMFLVLILLLGYMYSNGRL